MIETALNIEGMMCRMCESHINKTIRKNFNIEKVKSSHRKNQTVILSEQELDPANLQEVIERTGYHFKGMTTNPFVHSGLFSFHKN